ncbi:MAG: polysaccharide deacetylase family protein [Promethearchaeota archaeon]
MRELLAFFTMDVERVCAESPGGGPRSWEVAGRCARSYAEVLNERGFPVTFFVVPGAAGRLSPQLGRLASRGNELGLHLHLDSLGDNYLRPGGVAPLGAHSAGVQAEFVDAAVAEFVQATGTRPLSFRPGYFSANDETFPVLASRGIACSSASLPGRCRPDIHADWVGTRRDIHATDSGSRLRAGDLPLVEVPVTVRLNLAGKLGRLGDVRFERLRGVRDLGRVAKAVRQSLRWQERHGSPANHVCLFTHDTVDYSPPDPGILPEVPNRRRVLEAVLELLERVAREGHYELVGATCRDVGGRHAREKFYRRWSNG